MKQKFAVVTGASKGIGFAVAKFLLAEGYIVYGLSRKAGSLEGVRWMTCDVTQKERRERLCPDHGGGRASGSAGLQCGNRHLGSGGIYLGRRLYTSDGS
ncbi:MAG: SDR family NAD(P)-dependent oxidoreductase [Emergencia timonensis]